MIKFIEKEGYYDDSSFTGQCYMFPTYMVKEGKEYFMYNRREPDEKWALEENEQIKRQLIENGGAYFRFSGSYSNPMKMIKEIAERKHHFTDPGNTYYGSIEENGFLDFHGNRKEASAAFHYRIYDVNLAERICKFVEMLNMEEWEKLVQEVKKSEK